MNESGREDASDGSPTTPELIRELAVDIKDVGLGELEATKLEISDELARLKTAIALMAGAGGFAMIGIVLVSFAAARGVELWLEIDIAYALLIVATAFLVAAEIIFLLFSEHKDDVDVVPETSAADAAKDAKWIKHQVKSAVK